MTRGSSARVGQKRSRSEDPSPDEGPVRKRKTSQPYHGHDPHVPAQHLSNHSGSGGATTSSIDPIHTKPTSSGQPALDEQEVQAHDFSNMDCELHASKLEEIRNMICTMLGPDDVHREVLIGIHQALSYDSSISDSEAKKSFHKLVVDLAHLHKRKGAQIKLRLDLSRNYRQAGVSATDRQTGIQGLSPKDEADGELRRLRKTVIPNKNAELVRFVMANAHRFYAEMRPSLDVACFRLLWLETWDAEKKKVARLRVLMRSVKSPNS